LNEGRKRVWRTQSAKQLWGSTPRVRIISVYNVDLFFLTGSQFAFDFFFFSSQLYRKQAGEADAVHGTPLHCTPVFEHLEQIPGFDSQCHGLHTHIFYSKFKSNLAEPNALNLNARFRFNVRHFPEPNVRFRFGVQRKRP
jgi:hypothetical protein